MATPMETAAGPPPSPARGGGGGGTTGTGTRKRRLSMSGAALLPGPAPPGVFDRIASRRLRPQGKEWVLEAEDIRSYLPSLLRLLRDADESKVRRDGKAQGAPDCPAAVKDDSRTSRTVVTPSLFPHSLTRLMQDGGTTLVATEGGEAGGAMAGPAGTEEPQDHEEEDEEVTARVLDKLMEIAIRYPMVRGLCIRGRGKA